MPDNLGRVDDDVRTAVRYAALVAVIGIGFLAAAALLTGDCPAPGSPSRRPSGARCRCG